jgi:CRP/FNR family cyclic AMP-dependent transcriptional regulator
MISPEVLRRFPFFGFMDEAQLRAVSMIASLNHSQPGETIVEDGLPAASLYFLIDGSASYYYCVTTEHDPSYSKEYFVSDFNPGEVFGISALIEPYIYTATVRAEKPSKLIKIDAAALRALCEVDVRLSSGLMHAVARAAMERLQQTRVLLIAAKA